MNPTYIIAGLALLITFTQLVGLSLYKVGNLSARLESLELWRTNLRNDLHEISDQIKTLSVSITELKTTLEERTERRTIARKEL